MNSNEFDNILLDHDRDYLAEHPEIAAEYDKQKRLLIDAIYGPSNYQWSSTAYNVVTKGQHEALRKVNEHIQKKAEESIRNKLIEVIYGYNPGF